MIHGVECIRPKHEAQVQAPFAVKSLKKLTDYNQAPNTIIFRLNTHSATLNSNLFSRYKKLLIEKVPYDVGL